MAKDRVWKDDYLVKAYRLARQGFGDMRIAKTIGVTWPTFKAWLRKKEALRNAIQEGRDPSGAKDVVPFDKFVYKSMPPKLRKLYDEIDQLHKSEDPDSYNQVERILLDNGKRIRQHLFLHFLVNYSFNTSQACKSVNISMKELELWALDDNFRELLEEIQKHKRNYCEEALMDLVRVRDAGSVKFALQNLDRDRYGKQATVNVNVNGGVAHKHEHLVDVARLPLENRMKLLEALEAPATDDDVVDAEIVEQEDEG